MKKRPILIPEYEELAAQAGQSERDGAFLEAMLSWKKANKIAAEKDKEWSDNRAAFCMKAAPRAGGKPA